MMIFINLLILSLSKDEGLVFMVTALRQAKGEGVLL